MKINKTCLRVGNIIDVFGPCEVIAIEEKRIKVHRPGKNEGNMITESVPYDSLNLSAIPLTPNHLIDYGFQTKDGEDFYLPIPTGDGTDFNVEFFKQDEIN